ncbi:MAG: LuxR C-terminal-related transcriptional regulator [Candidatus Promineifilaceae bacterium]|nr:LuxR C-terminal-related transcriptional regulator [Candidatus Promineifilaceae bacterium]
MGNNIPIQLTPFTGRKAQILEIRRLLRETRLLTLIGPGGTGKTRLAVEALRESPEAYEDALFWIELASISEPALVARKVGAVIGAPEQPGRATSEALAAFLEEKSVLLVLDNCEHLLAKCAELVAFLLQRCPRLRCLTTSREPLAIAGERVFPVPALSTPSASALAELQAMDDISPAVLRDFERLEAVALFLDRAKAVAPSFVLEPENVGAVAAVCTRLDGLPLAIELAAARVNLLTPQQIARFLDDRFTLLRTRQSGVTERHQTLRSAIDWSFNLLTEAEQTLFRRMAVFPAGCTLSTAEAVGSGDGLESEQLLPVLSSLVDKSLVVAETLTRREARYSMLETIRQYAARKLEASGEKAMLHDRFLDHYCHLIEQIEPKLKGENQEYWLDWLQEEMDNIRAALSWSLESEQVEWGLRIAVALYQFWTIRDFRKEGLGWYRRLLEQVGAEISPEVRIEAFAFGSMMAAFHRQMALQTEYAEAAVGLAELADEGGKRALAEALGAQAFAARKAGDDDVAFTIALRALELVRELDDPLLLGLSLCYYSYMALSLGQYDTAREMLQEGLPLLRNVGDPYRLAMGLNYQGDLARCEQKYREAVAAYQESIGLLRGIDAVRDLASVFHNLGLAYLHLDDVERARALFKDSMAIHKEQQNRVGMAECLLGFAALALTDQMPAAATRLLAAAEALGGRHVTAEWEATRLEYESCLARAHSSLTKNLFQQEQATGRRMTLDRAVASALETERKGAAVRGARNRFAKLTPREREVALLVAEAQSNDEIADTLVLSKRTVETHVSNILGKLDFTSRTEIVRWAAESGLSNTVK